MQPSRRAFLGVTRRGKGSVLRPPWALNEQDFEHCCTRCGECIRACPTHLLVAGDGGYPQADFSPSRQTEGCTFCAACVDACRAGALVKTAHQAPWSVRAVINGDCLAGRQVVCYTCSDACEPRAIRFQALLGGMAIPVIEPDTCTGCGACVAHCPTMAIRIQPVSSQSQTQ